MLRTTHNRFQAICPTCHLLGHYQRREDAMTVAAVHSERCEGAATQVFDLMARVGQWEFWQFDGDGWLPVARRKPEKSI